MFEIGKTYHQEFENGDRFYARIVKRCANGNFMAMTTEGRRKPVQKSVVDHPSLPWQMTPEHEIPRKLRA